MKFISNYAKLPFSKGSFFILFLTLTLASSCGFILKKVYKIKKPRLENVESLNKFLTKYDYDTSKLVILNDYNTFKKFLSDINSGIPEALFFNNRGQLVDYRKSPEDCNGKISQFIEEVEAINDVDVDTTLKISELNTMINKELPTSSINVVITWAVYAGKLNEKKSFDWVTLIKDAKSRGVKINYCLLNCDVMEDWTDRPEK